MYTGSIFGAIFENQRFSSHVSSSVILVYYLRLYDVLLLYWTSSMIVVVSDVQ